MAITYGMSVKEFWEDDPNLFWAYRFSYYNKMTDKQEIFNYNAWLQGAYIYEAVQVALNNSFGKQKTHYPKQPYGIELKQPEMTEEKKQERINMQVADIRARIKQVNAIKGSATKGNETKGGEKVNE